MSDPLVDVGMPAHGRPLFLAEAVRSVLGQSHRGLRLVVLDDSEGQEIESAIEPFRDDPRLDYRRAEAMSAAEAMTALIGAAGAEFFAFLHDDDRWEAGFLERRLRFLEAHPECAMVFSGHVDINEQGQVTGRTASPYPEGVVARERIVADMQRRNVVDVMHSVLVRRSALVEAGPYVDPAFPRLFDWELWLRLVLRFPVGCVEEQDVAYRAHAAQISSGTGQAGDFMALYEHADALTAELAPQLRLGADERRARRARLRLSLALDRVQAGDVSGGRSALGGALRLDAAVVARDRRLAAVLAGMLGGRRGQAAVARLRAARYRHSHERRRHTG